MPLHTLHRDCACLLGIGTRAPRLACVLKGRCSQYTVRLEATGATPTSPVHISWSQLSSRLWVPANGHPGQQQTMAQTLESLQPAWEAHTEVPAPSFTPA